MTNNTITIYMKGDPGFKPAIMTKLGREGIHSAHDLSNEVISFTLPENAQIEVFKASIGQDIITDFNVAFFLELPEERPTTERERAPANEFVMSVWANKDLGLKGTTTKKKQEETTVF